MIIKAGDGGGAKQNPASMYSIYDNIRTVELYGGNNQIDTLVKSSEFDFFPVQDKDNEYAEIVFHIFPNPNNGEFFNRVNWTLDKGNVSIYGVMGNELQFGLTQDQYHTRIILLDNYAGVLLVKILKGGDLVIKRVLILK
ncbi:MAG: T9SS type A sorting domain-containing protein [Chlorobi bacterium]|nr:T9SS type A sorting domain-containing protein [Chlorobiota bacterium]